MRYVAVVMPSPTPGEAAPVADVSCDETALTARAEAGWESALAAMRRSRWGDAALPATAAFPAPPLMAAVALGWTERTAPYKCVGTGGVTGEAVNTSEPPESGVGVDTHDDKGDTAVGLSASKAAIRSSSPAAK